MRFALHHHLHQLLQIVTILMLVTLFLLMPRTLRAESFALPTPKLNLDFKKKANPSAKPYFFSEGGREHEIEFKAWYRTPYTSIEELHELAPSLKNEIVRSGIVPLTQFAFGPLVHRFIGGPQQGSKVIADWNSLRLVDGKVEVPYTYSGVWLLAESVAKAGSFDLPVPLNRDVLTTANWTSCGDPDPEHRDLEFFWYFWDPTRPGCDHAEGAQYRTVQVMIGRQTPQALASYPEYQRLIADGQMTLTLAFGYAVDQDSYAPASDHDPGARQYRNFLRFFRRNWGAGLSEEPILMRQYLQGAFAFANEKNADLPIGHRFTGQLNGVSVTVNVVIAAGIDPMAIFAKSFAHDHDDVFSWLGHSNIGAGFDVYSLKSLMIGSPQYYSIRPSYQVIYWGGCNSYSYYTQPFFEIKGGSKNLDIIANGLPSYFANVADSALIIAHAFLNWSTPMSYQQIVTRLEQRPASDRRRVLVAVLGDEDNEN